MVVGRRLRNYQRDLESTETLKQASLSKPAAALKLLFFPSWGIQGQADFPLRPGGLPRVKWGPGLRLACSLSTATLSRNLP